MTMVGTTQSIEAGIALARYLGIEGDKPQHIDIANGSRLTLSKKGDCYYFVTPVSCSCPAGIHNRWCKHRQALMDYLKEKNDIWNIDIRPKHAAYRPVPDEVQNDPVLAGYDGPAA